MYKLKRFLMLSLIIFLIIVIVIIILNNKKNRNKKSNLESVIVDNSLNLNIEDYYDEKSGIYEIVDKKTGEPIATTTSKNEAIKHLNKYKENPTYRSVPPTVIEDY